MLKSFITIAFVMVSSMAFSIEFDRSRAYSPSLNDSIYLGLESFNDITARNISGVNPDIDSSDGFELVWGAGFSYVPPTQPRVHTIYSTSDDDKGLVVSFGDSGYSKSTEFTDESATFVSDGVQAGDFFINDSYQSVRAVLFVVSETELAVSPSRDMQRGLLAEANRSNFDYRIFRPVGLGAASVYLTGLNERFEAVSEIVILDGLAGSQTEHSYIRQNLMRVLGSGSSNGNVGNIDSIADTDLTETAHIEPLDNQSLSSIFSIPIGKTALIMDWWGSVARRQAGISRVRLRIGAIDGLSYLVQDRTIRSDGSSEFDHHFSVMFPVAGSFDIFIDADSDANNLGVTAGFDFILVDEE